MLDVGEGLQTSAQPSKLVWRDPGFQFAIHRRYRLDHDPAGGAAAEREGDRNPPTVFGIDLAAEVAPKHQ